jgi:hypothetical protein
MGLEIRDHRYYLPLLGAYGGLRLEEAVNSTSRT